MGSKVQHVGPMNANRVVEEYDTTLNVQLPSSREKPTHAISNMICENVTASERNQNLNISLKKQLEGALCGNDRHLKRFIEKGESSLPKHQKKDSHVAVNVVAANDRMEERSPNTSNYYFSEERPILNALYDPAFETMGLPIDPHIRLMKSLEDKSARDLYYKLI